MKTDSLIKATTWDTDALGIPTWELLTYSEETIHRAATIPGHQTLKVDPLADKWLLHQNGFYYCDTLIEPQCTADRLRPSYHPDADLSTVFGRESVLQICHGAFSHGRFHRDFNLSKRAADCRYDNWLAQLIDAGAVYGLFWRKALAGFIAHQGNSLVLHALAAEYRGKGLSKYWWSMVCRNLFEKGATRITSSISISNISVLNLYASLGFSFNRPKDVYHRLVPQADVPRSPSDRSPTLDD